MLTFLLTSIGGACTSRDTVCCNNNGHKIVFQTIIVYFCIYFTNSTRLDFITCIFTNTSISLFFQ